MKKAFFTLCFCTIFVWMAEGAQTLHTRPDDKPYQTNQEVVQFVETTFKKAIPLESDAGIMHYASDHVNIEGIFVELGTGLGRTTNFLAALNPGRTIHTFDSYLGHPVGWNRGDKVLPKDFFAWPADKPLPLFLNNVHLTQGWFADTLPPFISALQDDIAFIHVDCETYESTSQALELLAPKIVEGTVILFDEFYNYPNYENHEYKAFQEFLNKHSFEAEYLAFNALHEQALVRLHKCSPTKNGNAVHEIELNIKISCPPSDEFQQFIQSIPSSGNYSSSFAEWKSSFLTNINQLIHLIESEKVFSSWWSVKTEEE